MSSPSLTISLNLTDLRMMKVSISGAVQQPGAYELSPIDRMSTLIALAEGFIDTDQEESALKESATASEKERKKKVESELERLEVEREKPSKRLIRLISSSGTEKIIDYLRFERTGDLSYNPVLKDGCLVHVPLINVGVGVVHIFGAVKSPGEYEFRSDDRLLDLVEIAGGFSADVLMNNIRILSFAEGGSCTETIVDVTELTGDDKGPKLNPDDRIFIRWMPEYHRRHYVEVKGAVRFPGVYPIEDNVTMLSELIDECGGFNEKADFSRAHIVRRLMEEIDDPEYERLLKLPFAEMSNMESEYFKVSAREITPRVVTDFEKLFNENELGYDVALRHKDLIEIPELSRTVYVVGGVRKPGLITYNSGADFRYYINEAGGFNWNANKGKLRLIKARTGIWLDVDEDTEIGIGDTIFIPERKEINWWEYTKDVLLVLSQVVTIFVLVRTL